MLAHLNRGFSDLSWLKFVFCLSLLPLLSSSVNILWWFRDSDWFTELFCYWLSIYGYGSGSRNLCLGGGWGPAMARGLGTAYQTYLYLTNSNDCQKNKKIGTVSTRLAAVPSWWMYFLPFLSLSFFWGGGGLRWVCPPKIFTWVLS